MKKFIKTVDKLINVVTYWVAILISVAYIGRVTEEWIYDMTFDATFKGWWAHFKKIFIEDLKNFMFG